MKKLVKLAAPLFIALSVTAAFADDMKPADTNANTPAATESGKPAKGKKGKKGAKHMKKGSKKGADKGAAAGGSTEAPKAQ